ncbi:maleylpyruvate isomerase N-terminal domain-containing protein [Sphaerisporangium fuscum]|uniref:maleylpyruvate isomerase N-terminal domain-containing protein n=1 Tax=Sphaerisporangium fuscum TaxID=2835868 RepID=UPI001BDC5900|nr:maleylpyruvate isomerase N-terminal domain-containing protein [Sphaerisporangium fuscum]
MSDIADRYDRLAEGFLRRIEVTPPDKWDAPSPCEGWVARDVVTHVVDNHRAILAASGRGHFGPPGTEPQPAAGPGSESGSSGAGPRSPSGSWAGESSGAGPRSESGSSSGAGSRSGFGGSSGAGSKSPSGSGAGAPAEAQAKLDGAELAAAFDDCRRRMVALLNDPAAAGHSFPAPIGMVTFETAVDVIGALELLVHTWDLARAVGGDERLDQEAVAATFEALKPHYAALQATEAFLTEVTPPPGADIQTRFLCFLGRTP